jgi:hypothetical protein
MTNGYLRACDRDVLPTQTIEMFRKRVLPRFDEGSASGPPHGDIVLPGSDANR